MSNPSIYQNQPLTIGETITLSDDAFGHTVRVLRLKDDDIITLFNGELFNNALGEYQAELINVSKKQAQVVIKSFTERNVESPLNIHLGQGISRGDRMDFTLQKSVELGVNTITPLFTERCGVKLSGERLQKKIDQWQKIEPVRKIQIQDPPKKSTPRPQNAVSFKKFDSGRHKCFLVTLEK